MNTIGDLTSAGWEAWVAGISTLGLVTAIFALIFMITFFILYFQFLMRGLENMILRVGMPLACVGLIDNDKGVFRPYLQKFFQSMLAVLIQICLSKLAVKTPRFLQDFLITTGSGGGGTIVNNVYHSVRLVQMLRKGG